MHRLRSAGLWTSLHPGVYAITQPSSRTERWLQGLFAAVLWAGVGCAVSRRAAADLWGLDAYHGAAVVEISTTRHVQIARSGTKVRRVVSLPAADVCIREGLPVTTIERTVLDLGSVASAGEVELAVECALRRRLTTVARLEARLTWAGATTTGIGVLRDLLSQTPNNATESALEAEFWMLLRRSRLPLPARQFEIRDKGGRVVARSDFAYPDARLALETEGFRFHSGRKEWRRDLERHNVLTELGWTVLRFTWEDVSQRQDAVIRRIREALTERIHSG